MPSEKEFKVNEYITLKLEEGVTYMYINGVRSKRSLGLFLNIPPNTKIKYHQIELLDEAVEGLQNYTDIYYITDYYDSHSRGRDKYNITAEQEFWAHCSNLQVWVENDYDMSLIHSSLGYNLLKSLSNHGIQPAKERYKSEIVKRFRTGHIESSFFLLKADFHKRFRKEEREQFFLKKNPKLNLNIKNYLAKFDPESPVNTVKKPAIELLEKLKFLGDEDAKIILTDYSQKFKSRSPKILKVDEFWKIIDNSYRESKGILWEQEELLIQSLKYRSIDEIYMFGDYISYFTSTLYNDSLLQALMSETRLHMSDDSWHYIRGHIIALGKEAYEMALYKISKFIETLKSGVYGEPDYLGHEFWSISYDAFKQKTGLTLDMEYFVSAQIREEIKKIHEILEKEHQSKKLVLDKEREFEINKYLTLKLENEKTIIYLAGEEFMQCKYLLLDIPIKDIPLLEDIESIDDASERLGWAEEGQLGLNEIEYYISPETEFWGHCSNLQVWAENNYDTRLLHSNLAFPLLKKLVNIGDPKAKKVFREEVAQRLESANSTVCNYLFNGDYLEYLPKNYLNELIKNKDFLKKLRLNQFPNLRTFIQRYLKDDTKDRLFDFYEVYEIYKELHSYDNDFNDFHPYSFERFLISELIKEINFESITLTPNDVRIFFEVCDKFNSLYEIEEAIIISIIVPFVLFCLKDNSKIKQTFLHEFTLRLNYEHNKKLTGIMLMRSFIEGCDKHTLSSLLQDSKSEFFDLLYDILKVSFPYGNLEWETWEFLDYEYEFWYEQLFEIVGNSISIPLKERIKDIIRYNEEQEILSLLYNRLFDKLDDSDLYELINDSKYKLIDIIFKILEKEENLIHLIEIGLFSDQFLTKFYNILRLKLIEISETNLRFFIKCGLINYLQTDDLSLLLNQNPSFLKDVLYFAQSEEWITDDNYDIEWPYKLFKKFQKQLPILFKNEILEFIKNCSKAELLQLIREDALSSLDSNELINLLGTSNMELTQKFIATLHFAENITNEHPDDLEWLYDWFFFQFLSIQKSRIVKLMITMLLEGEKIDMIHGIFKSRWLEYFSINELQKLIQNPKILLLERLISWIELHYKQEFFLERVIGLCYFLDQVEPEKYIAKIFNSLSKEKIDKIQSILLDVLHYSQESEIKLYAFELFIKYMDQNLSNMLEFVSYNREKFFLNNNKLIIRNRKLTDISKIRGLQYLVNLRYLDLHNNTIGKIHSLDNLSNLEYLNLSGNHILEISGLSKLTKLKELDISANKISEIEGLGNLVNLEKLNIKRNDIPFKMIIELGGTDFFSVKDPQQFVKYCKIQSK